MTTITAIITTYRRPQNLLPLVAAIRKQSVPAAAIWAWANEPSDKMKVLLSGAKLDRVVSSTQNAFFHGRFALALLADTEYVAIFDDDSIPGENWFANCLETMAKSPGILGTAGVVLHGQPSLHVGGKGDGNVLCEALFGPKRQNDPVPISAVPFSADYAKRTMHGWQRPGDETVEVDLVGQAWFLRTEWVKYLFACAPVTGTNGEDIELAARAWRLARIRSFCPAHPAGDQSRWGSTRGLELGLDDAAASLRVEHLSERRRVVEAEMAAGWRPLFCREQGRGNREQVEGEIANCELRIANLKSEQGRDAGGQCAPYDLGDALERQRDPLAFLRELRQKIDPEQRVVGSVANLRREQVIRGLIEGRWQNGRAERLRYFTRRELEKLFYRAGFTVAVRAARTWEDGLPSPSSNGDGLGNQARRHGPHPSPPPEGEGVTTLFAAGFSADEVDELKIERYRFDAVVGETRDYGLTSIVIVTHNELRYTHGCLESIRFVTDEPYELIVVDNGSTDGTVEYLRNCPDVKLIENADNRGFPAAVNQGIAASSGRQVLLLNNDVIVTTGWLRRMLEATEGSGFGVQGSGHGTVGNALRGVPFSSVSPSPTLSVSPSHPRRVGLVGPLTNNASGHQEIDVAYRDLACLDGFAWEHGKEHAGKVQEVDRLIGFCLLIRREVIDQVGLFDERFGIGNYEDDDYCRRARAAGWRLVVARDAYIHHFGHRSFEAAGVDLKALLENNKRLYDKKWAGEGTGFGVQGSVEGEEAKSQDPRPKIQDLHPNPKSNPGAPGENPKSCITLSLCMIVRDNERTIGACLESIRPWVDEMVVVDTGSTDATPEICRELGAQVYHSAWPDSFAIARNESLKHARGEWIFWMDSDDIIDVENGRKLRELVNSLSLPPGEGRGGGRGAQEDRAASRPAEREIANRELQIANWQLKAEDQPSKTQGQRPKTPSLNPKSNPGAPGENPKSDVLGFVMQVHCPGAICPARW